MPDIVIRKLDEATVEALKDAARCHGRSMQAEARMILEEAMERRAEVAGSLEAEAERRRRTAEFFAWADEFRKKQKPSTVDSTEIIREAREHGYSDYEW